MTECPVLLKYLYSVIFNKLTELSLPYLAFSEHFLWILNVGNLVTTKILNELTYTSYQKMFLDIFSIMTNNETK